MSASTGNSFGARARLAAGGRTYEIFRLDALEKRGWSIARLPYSLRILLENLLRREDGRTVRAEDVEKLVRWDPKKVPDEEIAFMPARVLMQDFTGVLAAPILLFVLYTWSALAWSYSEGERAGYVQKLSKKGWLCKTWEGELAMVSIPGTMPEKFYFTVRDNAVAARINASLGKRVALAYAQHKGVPTSCFGETEYFVRDVRVVE